MLSFLRKRRFKECSDDFQSHIDANDSSAHSKNIRIIMQTCHLSRQRFGTERTTYPFDLICHIAFDMPPLTRKERANNVKKRGYFGKYNEVAKQVLEALLDKYADEGLANLESMEVLKVPDVARFGTPVEILKCFGNKKKFMEAIAELENQLYVA